METANKANACQNAIDELVVSLEGTVKLLQQTISALGRIRRLKLPSQIENEVTNALDKNRESTGELREVCAHMARVMLNLEETLKANTLQ